MKITKLDRAEDGTIININIDMTNEENAFFVAFAFNHLMKQGLLRIDEESKEAVLVSLPEAKHEPVGVAPDLQ